MKSKKTSSTMILFFVFTLFIIISCESSETGPVVNRANPAAAAAQALILSGDVIDAQSSAGLSGATVRILKTDGTLITSLVAGSSGDFSYDISNVNEETLKVTATASGYGSTFALTKVDLTNKITKVVSIPLDKIQSTQVTVTSDGGSSTATSTESKGGYSVTLSVPSGAVSQSTSMQLAQLPVNNVDALQNASSNAIASVVNLQPDGISFAKAVKLTFPLPYKMNANDQLPLYKYVNSTWQTTGIYAIVDNTGYLAIAEITSTGEYSLVDNTKIAGTVESVFKTKEITEERSYSFSSGTLSVELPATMTFTRASQNVITEVPTDEWIFNTLAQLYGMNFMLASGPGSIPQTAKFQIAWPGAEGNPYKQNSDGSGNINRPDESGDWSLKIVFESYSETFANVTLDNSGYWQVTVNGTVSNWREKDRVWVWTAHNQGGVFEY